MSVDFRKLKSFVKIVDTGSMSRAASILRTAQPALGNRSRRSKPISTTSF